MFKKMLVAIDGSESADKALDLTLNLAKLCDAEVLIISVVQSAHGLIPKLTPATPPPEFYNFYVDHVKERINTVLTKALEKAEKRGLTQNVSILLLEGNPAERIVQTAKDKDFDVIVIGNRGLGGVKEMLLGSVSSRVADTAPCPVIIAK